MTAIAPTSTGADTSAHSPLTADELAQALKVEVYDREGKTKALCELTEGKRTILIFTRHFCKS